MSDLKVLTIIITNKFKPAQTRRGTCDNVSPYYRYSKWT